MVQYAEKEKNSKKKPKKEKQLESVWLGLGWDGNVNSIGPITLNETSDGCVFCLVFCRVEQGMMVVGWKRGFMMAIK